MDIALISLLLIICIVQYTKDYFTIESNFLDCTTSYEIPRYKEDGNLFPKEFNYKVKSYTYKITYKNKRIKYKTFNIIEDGR